MEKNVLSEERKADRTKPAVRTVNRQKESTSKSEEEQKPQKEKNPESAAEAKKAEKAQRNTDRERQKAERTKQKEEHAKRKDRKKNRRYSRKKKSAGAERNRGRSWKISWIRFRIRRIREPSAWFARRPESFYFIFCRPGFRYRQGSDSLIRRRPACSSVLFMRSIRSIRIISV